MDVHAYLDHVPVVLRKLVVETRQWAKFCTSGNESKEIQGNESPLLTMIRALIPGLQNPTRDDS